MLEKAVAETPVKQDFRYITYRRWPSENRNGTIVLTINLSGSLSNFEKALKFKADILLIQEHWRGPDDINSWQSKARHAGWHGAWSLGVRNPVTGRHTSGVAVLTRETRPIVQVGTADDRTITAMVPWSRRTALMVTSVYCWDSKKHDAANKNAERHKVLSQRAREYGRVP